MYYNYKHFHSMVPLTLVDADYMFMTVDVGAPVSTENSTTAVEEEKVEEEKAAVATVATASLSSDASVGGRAPKTVNLASPRSLQPPGVPR